MSRRDCVGWAKTRRASRVATCPPATVRYPPLSGSAATRFRVPEISTCAPKILLSFFQKLCSIPRIPLHEEGRCARSSRHAGRGAMAVRCRSVGRGLARTNGRLADVKAYGPGAPMLAPSPRVMIPPATVAKSRTPGRVRSKRESHRAGKAGRSRLHLWYLPPAFFLAGGPQASAGAWPSLRPLHERVKRSARLGRIRAARRRLHVRVTVNGSKLQRMIARWTVTHRRALKTMTRFLRTRATLRARPSWNANPEHGRQAGVGAYPRRLAYRLATPSRRSAARSMRPWCVAVKPRLPGTS